MMIVATDEEKDKNYKCENKMKMKKNIKKIFDARYYIVQSQNCFRTTACDFNSNDLRLSSKCKKYVFCFQF